LKIDQILYLADQEDAQALPVAENTPAPAPAPEIKPQPASARPAVVEKTSSPGVVVTPPPVSPSPSAQVQPTKPNIIKTTVSRPGVQTNTESGNAAQRSAQANKDLDDDDDDDQPASQNQSPLMVYVRPNSAVAARGQDLYVAVFVNGNGDMSSAHVTLTYDPSLLEVKGVRDSGLLSSGARAELQFTAEGGVLNVQMDRPQGMAGVPARGQLCLVVFAVKAPGQSPLVLTEQQTQFRNANGQPLPIKLNSSQVELR
jgi:hypothetical protein